jgi:Na+/H+-dicarboxylate symporter
MTQRSPRHGTALIFLGLFLGIVLGGFLPQDRFPFAFEAFHFLAKAFINLMIIAGTCGSFGLPGEAGVALLLAVDGIMDMARTVINVIGNGLASVVVAKWEGVYQGETLAPGPEPPLETTCS